MESKVTIAMTSLLPLLLISTITMVHSPYTEPLSRTIPTQIASPIKDLLPGCDNYDTINLWLSKQLRLSNIMEENILHLEIPNEMCEFYEKDAIQSLFENVEKIIPQNESKEFPKISGNLAKDLNQILPWLKKFLPKGLKQQKCCEELEKYLNEVQDHLQDKWENIKKEISIDIGKDNAKIKEKLQEKHDNLEEQIEEVQLQLEKIQEESVSEFKPKCCSKLNRKINIWQNELNYVNTEADDYNKEFGENLKNLKDKLESQDKKATAVSETLGKREKNIKEMTEKFGKGTKGSDCFENELEEEISKMEEHVKEQALKIDSSASHINITLCQENGDKLAKIESELEKLIKDKNKQGNESTGNGGSGKEGFKKEVSENLDGSQPETQKDRKKLLDEAVKLRESLKNSDLLCKKTDHLHALGDKLLKSTDQMNQTFNEHIKNSTLDLNEIKSLLKNVTDKFESIRNNRQNHENSIQNETEEEHFQKQLTNIQTELDKAKDDFNNLQNKLKEMSNPKEKPLNSEKHTLNENLKKELKKFNDNWFKADKRLRLLEESSTSKTLYRLLDTLQQSVNKSENEIGRVENLEQFHKANIEKLTNLENQVNPCRDSCRDLDLIDDLLDNIEDMERFFKRKLQIQTKPDDVLVGGIDFVDQITDPEVFPQDYKRI